MSDIQFLRSLQNMVIMAIGRCVLKAVSDGSGLQKVQVSALAGETLDGIDRVQNYGMTSRPKAGAQGIIVSIAGMRENAVVIAMDDNRYRLHLEEGEVALYDDQGQSFILKRGRVAEINTDELRVNAETRVVFNTPQIETSGKIEAAGDVQAGSVSLQNHTHTGDSGGNTSKPN